MTEVGQNDCDVVGSPPTTSVGNRRITGIRWKWVSVDVVGMLPGGDSDGDAVLKLPVAT